MRLQPMLIPPTGPYTPLNHLVLRKLQKVSPHAMVLYIHMLTARKNVNYSDKHWQELLGCKERALRNYRKELKDMGLLKVHKDNRESFECFLGHPKANAEAQMAEFYAPVRGEIDP